MAPERSFCEEGPSPSALGFWGKRNASDMKAWGFDFTLNLRSIRIPSRALCSTTWSEECGRYPFTFRSVSAHPPSAFRSATGTLELLFPSCHLGKDQGTHSYWVIGDIENPELRPIKGHPRFPPRSPHQPPPASCRVDNVLDFFCRSPQPASTATHAEMALTASGAITLFISAFLMRRGESTRSCPVLGQQKVLAVNSHRPQGAGPK
ncbi:uncharacterized protein CLUP02_12444 [Colletotrichum lupini]|uniref:Uncharacterized protein n=1 Tax=Colletotrichum lupini TaxID=145971 RepID=A0A9Q8T284_9PEZI|nr:uncharacterized protein CLUP02_12444 [Colletotrichum lupini]UQC86942.1 hypothetical protein CLUP02_12444 [Colletotrichum lupini]